MILHRFILCAFFWTTLVVGVSSVVADEIIESPKSDVIPQSTFATTDAVSINTRVDVLESMVQRLSAESNTVDDVPHPAWVQQINRQIEYPTARLTGLFQADFGWFWQDTRNRRALGDIQDAADFRRARLAATGNVAENVGYIVEMDFAFPGRPSFMDVRFDIYDVPVAGNVRIGHWRQPFGMDALTSVRELTFFERALPFAAFPFRQTGIGAYDTAFDQQTTWAVSVYKYQVDQFGGNLGDRGYGMATRETTLLYYDENANRLIHVGGAYSHNNPSDGTLRFASFPEFGAIAGGAFGIDTIVPLFVDTGDFVARHANVFGLEAAAAAGSFYMQSELMYVVADRPTAPTATFSTMYVYAAYLLTGEHRPYDRKNGVFGRVKPTEDFGRCGMGAWEIAARWSYLDLNSGGIAGGRLNNLTAGVNWYLNQFTKLQLNYIHSFLADPTFGKGESDLVALRAALDF